MAVHYPEAEMITLVMDNLSTHKKAAPYEVFEPEEAKRIAADGDAEKTTKKDKAVNS